MRWRRCELQRVGEVVDVDDGAGDACSRQPVEHVIDQRAALETHERLRHLVGQRAHARAEACGKHDPRLGLPMRGTAHARALPSGEGVATCLGGKAAIVPALEAGKVRVRKVAFEITPQPRDVT